MRFESKYRSAVYVVEPRQAAGVDASGRPVAPILGLRAQFSDHKPSFFDTEAAQRAWGWTDEQRLKVERHLLTHGDFGRALYLGDGEAIPEDHRDLDINLPEEHPAAGSEQAREPSYCQMTWDEGGFSVRCGQQVEAGEDFCPKHQAEIDEYDRAQAEKAGAEA